MFSRIKYSFEKQPKIEWSQYKARTLAWKAENREWGTRELNQQDNQKEQKVVKKPELNSN